MSDSPPPRGVLSRGEVRLLLATRRSEVTDGLLQRAFTCVNMRERMNTCMRECRPASLALLCWKRGGRRVEGRGGRPAKEGPGPDQRPAPAYPGVWFQPGGGGGGACHRTPRRPPASVAAPAHRHRLCVRARSRHRRGLISLHAHNRRA